MLPCQGGSSVIKFDVDFHPKTQIESLGSFWGPIWGQNFNLALPLYFPLSLIFWWEIGFLIPRVCFDSVTPSFLLWRKQENGGKRDKSRESPVSYCRDENCDKGLCGDGDGGLWWWKLGNLSFFDLTAVVHKAVIVRHHYNSHHDKYLTDDLHHNNYSLSSS